MEKLVEVQNFNTSWDSHYNMPKQYYDPTKRPTIDVPVKLLSRGRAPSFSDKAIAGSHIDDLTSETDGVGAEKKPSGRVRDVGAKTDGRLQEMIRNASEVLSGAWTQIYRQKGTKDMATKWNRDVCC